MNPLISSVTAMFVALAMAGSAPAQEFVSARPVVLTATILTQGPDASVTTVQGGTTITTKRVISIPFGNRDLLSMMLARQLIVAPLPGWNVVLLTDSTGQGGLYASKVGSKPVPVPGDLLTIPDFGAKVASGMTVTGAGGGTFGGLSETAFATLVVVGVPASGLATTGIAKADQGKVPSSDLATTTVSFTGGIADAHGDRLVKGVVVIEGAKGLGPSNAPPK